jgi:uncharacterized protein (TIGR00730 family)
VADVTELRRVCVFCGSSSGTEPAYVEAAVELGGLLAAAGVGLVYGGGSVGLMGRLADACMASGGEVTGVIPVGLFRKEVGHTALTELVEVPSMHERKQLMYDLADGFVALPGGLGTLEELAEVLTWNQLGILAKPVALLDVGGFWDGLVDWLTGAVEAGFVRAEHAASLRVVHEPRDVLDVLAAAEVPHLHKWLDLDET